MTLLFDGGEGGTQWISKTREEDNETLMQL